MWDSITEAGGKEFGSFNLPNDLLAKRHMGAAGSRAEEDVCTAHSLESRHSSFYPQCWHTPGMEWVCTE